MEMDIFGCIRPTNSFKLFTFLFASLAFLKVNDAYCDPAHTPRDCHRHTWERIGCHVSGRKATDKLQVGEITRISLLSLQELIEEVDNLYKLAETYDKSAMLDCLGFEVPRDCVTFNRTTTDDCFDQIYRLVGCSQVGLDALMDFRKTIFKQMSVGLLYRTLLNIKKQADKNIKESHIRSCYGTTFPSSCKFNPPHSIQCLIEVWEDICVQYGHGNPNNRSRGNRQTLANLPLDQLYEEIYNEIKIKDNNTALLCYGSSKHI